MALTALFVTAISVTSFIEIADAMTEADGQAFDHQVLALLRPYADDPGRPWGPGWLKEAAADITSLGGIAVLGLFALIVIVFLLSQRKWLSSLLLALGLAGGVMLSEGLKAVFERERPPQLMQAVETTNASFPSGHALLATVFYLSVAVMLTRAFPRPGFKIFVLGVGMVMALLVGLTRIYLGAHWATDVFAGWAAGSAWAMALWLAAYGIARWQKRRRAPLQDEPSPIEPETPEPPSIDDPTKV
ncbi:phosphatase PAP2 family protein [Brevundimonas sp. SL130]|uniref:phosphatase PAP2 family protein n=1 Tax=Brevundimonas sp. SL130 TaxID=2995143 RepID=UPI00226D0D84|nr:phosphatase PAP2 family protein [Brevundimonas sp. SL130]WAC59890.1 phosphatase PAP2 family protein [Brevundimonas sp. SL130]